MGETPMTTTSRTNEKCFSILRHAARHPDLRVLPLPQEVSNKGGVATRLLKSLLSKGLVAVLDARPADREWSRSDDGAPLTLVITPAGLEAIGAEVLAQQDQPSLPKTPTTVAAAAADDPNASGEGCDAAPGSKPEGAPFRAGTKGAAIAALLARSEGASLPELMEASGWQAHSVRGFLSGTLRKKHGLAVQSEPGSGGPRRYRVAA